MSSKDTPKKIRTFFAIEIPEIWQEIIAKTTSKLKRELNYPGIKWVKLKNLHLTLRFLGSISEEQLVAIKRETPFFLQDIKPFSVSFSDLILFPDLDFPRVIALKPTSKIQLVTLAISVDQCVVKHEIAKEKRAFNPHLTIAKIKSKIPTKKTAKILAKISIPNRPFIVDKIILIKSEPTVEGSQYTSLATFFL